MKSTISVFALCAALSTTDCRAWAPGAAGFASRTTKTRSSVDGFRQPFQIRPTTRTPSKTSVCATLEDEQKERSEAKTPGNDDKSLSSSVDSISDAFNKDDESEALTFFSPIPYEELTIGIVKETFKGENRVSQTPDSVRGLVKAGFTVIVESGGKKTKRNAETFFVWLHIALSRWRKKQS